MIIPLIKKLKREGRIVLFGSAIKTGSSPNDIDIAVVCRQGKSDQTLIALTQFIKNSEFEDLVYIQNINVYDQQKDHKKLFHILICEEDEMNNDIGIFKSVNEGIELKYAA